MRRNPSPYGRLNGVESCSGRLMRSYGLETKLVRHKPKNLTEGTHEKIISIYIINPLECN